MAEPMDTTDKERDRRGSVTSIGTSKRRRDDPNKDTEDEGEEDSSVYAKIRLDLEDYIFNENSKVNKAAAKHILCLLYTSRCV